MNTVNVTRNTAIAVSSKEYVEESKELATKILESNGYGKEWNKNKRRNHMGSRSSQERKQIHNGNVVFKNILPIPYVSDSTTDIIKKSLKGVGLEATVVELMGRSLRDLLVHNRIYDVRCERRSCRVCPQVGIGGCGKKGAIYKIKCSCGAFYIDETGRPLADRYNEHAKAAQKPHSKSYTSSVWAKHSKMGHGGNPLELSLEVLTVERKTIRRRALEAVYIKTLKPNLNVKEELTDMVSNFGVLDSIY